MEDEQKVKQALNAFVSVYNPDKSKRVAMDKSINAALQRNPTYPSKFGIREKKIFRAAWAGVLEDFIKENHFLKAELEFVAVATNYRDELKKIAPDLKFKLSHTQKSLSLFAKHYWALGIITEPTVCPVDRMILVAAGAPFNKLTWTSVDDKDEYIAQFKFIKSAAGKAGLTVAQWELFSFSPANN